MDTHGSPQPPQGEVERRIAEAFNAYFGRFDIRIEPEDVVVGSRRTIGRDGWAISYRIDGDAAGMACLEFYATHRMTNDRHVVISADGQLEHLDAISEMVIFDPKTPGSQQAAIQEFRTRNQAIAKQLQDRGLYPHGQNGQAGAAGR